MYTPYVSTYLACSLQNWFPLLTTIAVCNFQQNMKFFCFVSLFGISGSYALTAWPTIKTSSGPVRGHAAAHESSVSAYLGIPYALPPVGNRRFMPPEKYHGDVLINADRIVSPCDI